jgi:hypothetical protein
MLGRIRDRFKALRPLLLLLVLTPCLPSCASNQTRSRNPAADDLDAARSDFDRHTPPGGD